MKEEWKTIEKFPDYAVSNLGRVKRILKKRGTSGNRIITYTTKDKCGYNYKDLRKNKKKYRITIHKLVLDTFVGIRPEGCTCNHKDGNKDNNKLDNLEWIIHIENIHHAIRIGLSNPIGENNGRSKLKEYQVIEILHMLNKKLTQREIAKIYGISQGTVRDINLNKIWKHIIRQ